MYIYIYIYVVLRKLKTYVGFTEDDDSYIAYRGLAQVVQVTGLRRTSGPQKTYPLFKGF